MGKILKDTNIKATETVTIIEENLNLNLEQAFEELEEKINKLEDENISLEDSFRYYQEGMKLLKLCNDQIDTVEKKVMKINETGVLDEF